MHLSPTSKIGYLSFLSIQLQNDTFVHIVIPTAPELKHGGRGRSCYVNLDISTSNKAT